MRGTLALLALGALVAGCGSGGTLSEQRSNLVIPVGSFHELNLDMEEGQSLEYSWSTTGRVYFDVHSHRPESPGQSVLTWTQTYGTSGAGTHKADLSEGHSFFWRNESQSTVQLTYSVKGEATFVSHSGAGA